MRRASTCVRRGVALALARDARAIASASEGWARAMASLGNERFGALERGRGLGIGRMGAHPWASIARSVFIQTSGTPNPQSLMFQPGREVYAEGSKNFGNAREAMASPLAKRLFAIDGVVNVFFGIDFVTVTKDAAADWETVKPRTFEAIMDFYASGEAVMDEAALEASGTSIREDDDEIVAMIKELLETRIRPAVAEDGGDIVFKKFDHESGVVTVQLQGSCDGCPSSSVTLKSGIENMLMHYVPEVKGVVQAGPDDEEMDILELANLHRGRR